MHGMQSSPGSTRHDNGHVLVELTPVKDTKVCSQSNRAKTTDRDELRETLDRSVMSTCPRSYDGADSSESELTTHGAGLTSVSLRTAYSYHPMDPVTLVPVLIFSDLEATTSATAEALIASPFLIMGTYILF
jgi:hypothetical protein